MSPLSLGNIIRLERHRKHLTQSQLAALLGISRQTLIHMEQDKVSIPFHIMARLQKILDLSLDHLATLLHAPDSWRWFPDPPTHSGPVVAAIVFDQLIVAPTLSTLTQDVSNGWWDATTQTIHWYSQEAVLSQIFVAGCDPFLPWLARSFHENHSAFRLIPFAMSSQKAFNALRSGLVHLAGSHLYNPQLRKYNQLSTDQEKWAYTGYLEWEEGRVFSNKNADPLFWALREPGSEALALWERQHHGDPDRYHIQHFLSHPDLIRFVQSSGHQGVSIGSLAHLYGLSFEPWALEQYEWVCHPSAVNTPWFKAFISVLQQTSLSQQLAVLPHQRCFNWAQVRMD